jgi:transcriptional regulator GlxA family with amidase domain
MSDALREIWLALYPDANLLDVTGPAQVFCTAQEQAALQQPTARPAYRIRLLSLEGGPIRTSAGVELQTEPLALPRADQRVTLVVCGGHGSEAAMEDVRLLQWLKAAAPLAERVASVCTGVFVLAAAGLLEGRRVATHWDHCSRLQQRFPRVHVDPDAIYIEDRGYWTSAGVTSGLDLALALIKSDLGHELAGITARRLVFYLHRPGGQSQFSTQLLAQELEGSRIRAVAGWIVAHPGRPHLIEDLAAIAAMSPRTMYRLFREELGQTPAEFVEHVRLENAKRLLEHSQDNVDSIARKSGFGDSARMRAAFGRRLQVSPLQYRARFAE